MYIHTHPHTHTHVQSINQSISCSVNCHSTYFQEGRRNWSKLVEPAVAKVTKRVSSSEHSYSLGREGGEGDRGEGERGEGESRGRKEGVKGRERKNKEEGSLLIRSWIHIGSCLYLSCLALGSRESCDQ